MKLNKPHNLIAFLLLLFSSSAFGQNIKGEILTNKNESVQFAQVYNSNSKSHTHTNENGSFDLNDTKIGDTLTIYHVAFKTKSIVVDSSFLTAYLVSNISELKEVVVSAKTDVLNNLLDVNLIQSPVNSSQDLLKNVPGLIIGQHAGGGKAEQIFLRGFDIDHGTDLAINVDGMPVNMVSHSHGQGYADMHFVIPETVEKIKYEKGSYNASKGNFATAGFVDFKTKKNIENSIKLEVGDFNTKRLVTTYNLVNTKHQKSYVATEFIGTEGPFDSSQNFNRINLFGKYSFTKDKTSVTAQLSTFSSSWDASGQIPVRAINNGSINRFGAIDDTEGGFTSRTNALLNVRKIIDENTFIKTCSYFTKYNFELFSNFTFFLNDTANGDQIRQYENRDLYGFTSEYHKTFDLKESLKGNYVVGVSLRYDKVADNELSHTLNRKNILSYSSLGDVNETNYAVFAKANFDFKKWRITPGLRTDYFEFVYQDKLETLYDKKKSLKAIVSPKLSLVYSQSDKTQLFAKFGKGFHSNDTRVVVQENNNVLPASYGSDFGFVWKPKSNLVVNAAYWNLYLEQEFVYVGDEGVVEPSGKTFRNGVDLAVNYQPRKWMHFNTEASYTNSSFINAPSGSNNIPLAPVLTLVGSAKFKITNGMYTKIDFRHVGDRAANEDNSIVAEGYTVTDLNLGYEAKKVNVSLSIQNLFNTEWNETQFATESRLKNESSSVEEIHFTPGTPFFAKAIIQYKF